MSESSWIALVNGKERDWWSIDLEGDMEKLEVVSKFLVQDRRRIRRSRKEDGPRRKGKVKRG